VTHFDFSATFKPTLVDGFDEIKMTELQNGINDLVNIQVSDDNPFSTFDYEIGIQNVNEIQKHIVHQDRKTGQTNLSHVPFSTWLANDFGFFTKTKSFKIICTDTREQNAPTYLANTFNWVYSVKRVSDGKTKSVTRKIKIVEDYASTIQDRLQYIVSFEAFLWLQQM
jgi:hypothetical protein